MDRRKMDLLDWVREVSRLSAAKFGVRSNWFPSLQLGTSM